MKICSKKVLLVSAVIAMLVVDESCQAAAKLEAKDSFVFANIDTLIASLAAGVMAVETLRGSRFGRRLVLSPSDDITDSVMGAGLGLTSEEISQKVACTGSYTMDKMMGDWSKEFRTFLAGGKESTRTDDDARALQVIFAVRDLRQDDNIKALVGEWVLLGNTPSLKSDLFTGLRVSAQYGYKFFMECLLVLLKEKWPGSSEAEFLVASSRGNKPLLFLAAANGEADIADLLLNKGIDPRSTYKGKTAVQVVGERKKKLSALIGSVESEIAALEKLAHVASAPGAADKVKKQAQLEVMRNALLYFNRTEELLRKKVEALDVHDKIKAEATQKKREARRLRETAIRADLAKVRAERLAHEAKELKEKEDAEVAAASARAAEAARKSTEQSAKKKAEKDAYEQALQKARDEMAREAECKKLEAEERGLMARAEKDDRSRLEKLARELREREDSQRSESKRSGPARHVLAAVATAGSGPVSRQHTQASFNDAARRGDIKAMQACLDQGLNINGVSNAAITPLLAGIRFGPPEAIRFLLDKGADCNQQNAVGDHPIITAVQRYLNDEVHGEAIFNLLNEPKYKSRVDMRVVLTTFGQKLAKKEDEAGQLRVRIGELQVVSAARPSPAAAGPAALAGAAGK